jgi:hypothetical protein
LVVLRMCGITLFIVFRANFARPCLFIVE